MVFSGLSGTLAMVCWKSSGALMKFCLRPNGPAKIKNCNVFLWRDPPPPPQYLLRTLENSHGEEPVPLTKNIRQFMLGYFTELWDDLIQCRWSNSEESMIFTDDITTKPHKTWAYFMRYTVIGCLLLQGAAELCMISKLNPKTLLASVKSNSTCLLMR